MTASRKKVLLLELNEINWGVIDKLIADHGPTYLPNIARLRETGCTGTQTAVERPPLLDPWITWVTLHTGVSPSVHGASVLEQDAETISAKRTWHYAAEAGRSVGVFGSISAYPPFPVRGFVVPGPFAPTSDTFPPELRPIQEVNRRYTQVHNKTTKSLGLYENLQAGTKLLRSGLKFSTCMKIAGQLVNERVASQNRWRRVALQPLLNFDVFSKLYREQRPDFATWHSNHAAHYMHHYWRAWDDSGFMEKASQKERDAYGEAVPYGYRICDELIGRAMNLIDDETVLVVASSMGQQPYVSEKYQKGKIIVRIKDIEKLLTVVGRSGIEKVVPTMVPQWNLTVPDADKRHQLKAQFGGITRSSGGAREPGFSVSEVGDCLTITPFGLAQAASDVTYTFPETPERPQVAYPLEQLFATDAPTVKQGMHHIDGLLSFFGAGIKRGEKLPQCTNLDVAPTLLSLMGIPVPPAMEGRVLSEAMA
jgi:predicted AlkP superfamily phosphohydrolase/phosphomutase